MPIHDFHCPGCSARFELLVRANAVPVCPVCSRPDPEKLLSSPAPQGKSAGIIARARAKAARAGHLSNN